MQSQSVPWWWRWWTIGRPVQWLFSRDQAGFGAENFSTLAKTLRIYLWIVTKDILSAVRGGSSNKEQKKMWSLPQTGLPSIIKVWFPQFVTFVFASSWFLPDLICFGIIASLGRLHSFSGLLNPRALTLFVLYSASGWKPNLLYQIKGFYYAVSLRFDALKGCRQTTVSLKWNYFIESLSSWILLTFFAFTLMICQQE